MKKIAIVVEGQSEQIFIDKLLREYWGTKVFVHKIQHRGKANFIPFRLKEIYEYEVYALLINGGGDQKVNQIVLENQQNMLENRGFDKVIGIRDVYPHKRNEIEQIRSAIQNIFHTKNVSASKVEIILAIMEIEAWFLAESSLFERIDSTLTVSYIEDELGVNLQNIDPQEEFDHPSKTLEDILGLVNMNYSKRKDQISNIVKSVDYSKLCFQIPHMNKIQAFCEFMGLIQEVN